MSFEENQDLVSRSEQRPKRKAKEIAKKNIRDIVESENIPSELVFPDC